MMILKSSRGQRWLTVEYHAGVLLIVLGILLHFFL